MATTEDVTTPDADIHSESNEAGWPSTCDIFETHEDFSKLLAGVHRRRVPTIAAPAVTRHLAFWNPPRLGPAEAAERPEQARQDDQPARRRQQADQCVTAIYKGLLDRSRTASGAAPVTRLRTNSGIGDEARVIVLFASVINEADGGPAICPEGIKPDAYRAIKIFFDWHGIKSTLSFELHSEYLSLTIILDASEQKPPEVINRFRTDGDDVFTMLHDALKTLALASAATDNVCKSVHSQLYHDIWRFAEKELLKPMADLGDVVGKKFVDFRGVALGPKGDRDDVEFSRPFDRTADDNGTGLERASACNIQDFDTLWKFITCALPRDTEFTLSRFLTDRAFYATALGVQPEIFVGTQCTPLYYLLYEDTMNRLQLGRLIYRLHRAGTARIAAIMHFDVLRRASDILKSAEGALEKAAWLLGQEQKSGAQIRQSLREWHEQAENKLAEIARLKLDGTLDARVERSRYYVNQFARMTAGLRIERVSGFQPYDEFVNQRMGPVFEYIDSLGRIYARVQNDRSILLGRMQTLDTLHHEKLIAEAQRIADIALSCALGPYYVGYLFVHAFEGYFQARTVWLSALIFGLTMFIMIRFARPGPRTPWLLATRLRRFGVALLIAVPLAIIANRSIPAAAERAPAAAHAIAAPSATAATRNGVAGASSP